MSGRLLAVLDPDSDAADVDMAAGIEELKRRLEILLGQYCLHERFHQIKSDQSHHKDKYLCLLKITERSEK